MERKKENMWGKRERDKDWSQEGGFKGRGGTCLLASVCVCVITLVVSCCSSVSVVISVENYSWLFFGDGSSSSSGVAGEKYGVMQHRVKNKPFSRTPF